MANRKRNIQVKFYVTAEEKELMEQKMSIFSVKTGIWSPIKILASLPGTVIIRGVAKILALPLANSALSVALKRNS